MFTPQIMLCIFSVSSDVNQDSPHFEIRTNIGSDTEPITLFTLLLECEHLAPYHSELYDIGLKPILILFPSHCMPNSYEHLMKKECKNSLSQSKRKEWYGLLQEEELI